MCAGFQRDFSAERRLRWLRLSQAHGSTPSGQRAAGQRPPAGCRASDVQYLAELVAHGGVPGAAKGNVPGGVAPAGVAGGGTVSGKSGSGCGRTRRLAGRGSHPSPLALIPLSMRTVPASRHWRSTKSDYARASPSWVLRVATVRACTSGLVAKRRCCRASESRAWCSAALVGGVGLPPPLLHLPGAPGRRRQRPPAERTGKPTWSTRLEGAGLVEQAHQHADDSG